MINKTLALNYCSEDISKIENYDKAVADTKTWDIHHKAEILPCGIFSRADLEQFGLYCNRPANELIFLSHSEHMRLHGNNRSEATCKKLSKALKGKNAGKVHSQECKDRISASLKGKIPWNKGKACSEEVKQKIRKSVSNALKGHIVSEDTKRKQRLIKKNRILVKQFSCSGELMNVFDSLRQAEKETGISRYSIANNLKTGICIFEISKSEDRDNNK